MEQWYTLHTKPNAEYQVAAVLEQKGIRTFLPEIEAPKTRIRRKKKPFFPCYLFIHLDFKAVGKSQVQWTPGLRRVVAFGNRPVPVPDEVIDLVRHKLGELEANAGLPRHTFKPGDTVRITDGPFRDMRAIFEGPARPARRVQVLLSILGASRVQIDVTELELASSAVEKPGIERSRRTRGRGRRIGAS